MSPLDLTILTVVPTVAVGLAAVFLWIVIRRRQRQPERPLEAPQSPPQDFGIQDTAIQSLSARLAAIEGRIGGLAATLEGVPVLQQRMAAIETHMPALQEAYEKYADQISRADKRETERTRRNKKDQGISAGEAAAALTGEADAGGTLQPTQSASPPSNTSRAGILGQGGRNR